MPSPADRLATLYDAVFTNRRTHAFIRLFIWLAVVGFVVHLGLIFLARHLSDPPPLVAIVDTNYLSSLYTPFSFILFYEVLLLILAIPKSTTRSVGKQYELISLIVIRNVFKDISAFESFEIISDQFDAFVAVLVDMGGGLLMFLLVGVFYHVYRRGAAKIAEPEEELSDAVKTFIKRKKAVTVLLAVLLFALASYNLYRWSLDVYLVAYQGMEAAIDVKTIFYVDLFTVMIFTDVLVLILSMLQSDDYQHVFRNAGFIISTILIRFSLTLQKPYDVELAILAMVFGILVLLIYYYFATISKAGDVNESALPAA